MIRLEGEARSINCCGRVKKRLGRLGKKAIRSLKKSFVRKGWGEDRIAGG